MIRKVQLGLAYNPDFFNENQERMNKQNGETLAVLNDYLNNGGRILAKERIESKLGSELVFVVFMRDREEPTP